MAIPLDMLGPGALVQVPYDKINPAVERGDLPLSEGRVVRDFVVSQEKLVERHGTSRLAVQLKHPSSAKLWWCWKADCAIYQTGPERLRFGAREEDGGAAAEGEEEEPASFDLLDDEEDDAPRPVTGPGMKWGQWDAADLSRNLTQPCHLGEKAVLSLGADVPPHMLLRAFMPPATMERVLRATSPKLVASRKMALVLVGVVFTLVLALNLLLAPLLEGMALWQRILTIVTLQVMLMTYLVMPRVTRLLRPWLYR